MEHDAESSKRYKENWGDAVQASKADAAEIAELKEAYALLFKAHAIERSRWEEGAAKIETLRTQLAHWKVFGEHAEGERSRLQGEVMRLSHELARLRHD